MKFDNLKERIQKALIERKLGGCPLCGTQKWILADGFVYLPAHKNTELFGHFMGQGGPGLPMIAIACSNCGNTQLLNLITLGLLESPKKEKEN